jgi:predicted NAD/FAD-dependent oxidoreductase
VTAAGRLDDPESAVEPVLAELRRVLGPDVDVPPDWARAHAWPLASALHLHDQSFGWHEAGVGVCGDAWGPRSRVEQAWLSGHLLGEQLAVRL